MSAPELQVGYVVAGKYAIRSPLRQGGAMASYRATGPKNREVVLKICDPAILSFPAVVQALAQYQSLSAKLPPQQVVPIVDSGTDANSGSPFTVLDFEARPSLAQLIERAPLATTQIVALVRNLARAVDMLHANGIAGLTLHPSNVFVAPNTYETRIADFGASLVRHALPLPPEKAARWLPWLAPEQIKGQAPPAPPSDIFALALLAFFAATGKPYWRSIQAKTLDPAALRREILGERMPASVRAGEFAIAMNPAADAVFGRALTFRPADRFGTAGEFAASLEAALTGRSAGEITASRESAADLTTGDAEGARRKAPPPRKMPLRSTMVGIGQSDANDTSGALGTAAGARPAMNTMLGIGDRVLPEALPAPSPPLASPTGAVPAQRKPAPPPMPAPVAAEAVPRAMPTAPAKQPSFAKTTMFGTPPPAQPTPAAPATQSAAERPLSATRLGHPTLPAAPVGAVAPAPIPAPVATFAPTKPAPPPTMPAGNPFMALPPTPSAPAKYAEPPPPAVAPPQREPPPALIMAPPPAAMAEVLATFEATPFVPPPASPPGARAPSNADVGAAPPAWSTSAPVPSAEVVQTDVAMVGADFAALPSKSKKAPLLWVAGIGGLLVVTAGVALALASRSPSSNAAATEAKATATSIVTAVDEAPPAPVEPPAAPAPPVQEPAVVEPAAVAPPAPPPPEPAPPDESVAPAAVPQNDPGTPRATNTAAPAPKKPCGKFLKRCK